MQRLAGLLATPCPSQPLAVQQLRPCRVGRDRGPRQLVERRPELFVGLVAGRQRAPAPERAGPEPTVSPTPRLVPTAARVPVRRCRSRRTGRRTRRDRRARACRARCCRGRRQRRAAAERGVVPTGAELEHGERRVGVVDGDALSALVGVLHHAPRAGPRRRPRLPATRRAAPGRAPVSRAVHATR